MLKIKLEFEFEIEDIKEIFEANDKKFTRKKLAALKAELKENGGLDDFAYNLKSEVESLLDDYIANQFEDEEE
jgi:hypothetical protein